MSSLAEWHTGSATRASAYTDKHIDVVKVKYAYTSAASIDSFKIVIASNMRQIMNWSNTVSQKPPVLAMVSKPATYTDIFAGFEDYTIPDWDGEGAQPVQRETLEASHRIVNDLPFRLQRPEAAPGADGSIGREWVWELNGKKTKIFIDVGPSTQIAVYLKLLDRERHERKFSGLDEDALSHIHTVFQRVESAISFD